MVSTILPETVYPLSIWFSLIRSTKGSVIAFLCFLGMNFLELSPSLGILDLSRLICNLSLLTAYTLNSIASVLLGFLLVSFCVLLSKNSQNSYLSISINSIESIDYGQLRANCPFRGNSLILSKDIGNQWVEGVNNRDIQVTSQYIKPVEGDEYFDFCYIELFKQFNALVTSPLEGVRIFGRKYSQSALIWFMLVFVTFSAWITNYLPILSLVWIFSTAICDWELLSSSVGLF